MGWRGWRWRIIKMPSKSYLENLQEIGRTNVQKDFLTKVKMMGQKLNSVEAQINAGLSRGLNYVVDDAMKNMGEDYQEVYEEMGYDWWNNQRERKQLYLKHKQPIDRILMQYKMKLKKEIPMIRKNMMEYIKLAKQFKEFVEKNGESVSSKNARWYQMLGWQRVKMKFRKGWSEHLHDSYQKALKHPVSHWINLIPEKFIKGISDDYDTNLSDTIFGQGSNTYLHHLVNY